MRYLIKLPDGHYLIDKHTRLPRVVDEDQAKVYKNNNNEIILEEYGKD